MDYVVCLADVSILLSNCVVESSSETTHQLQHDQTLFLQRVWLVRLMVFLKSLHIHAVSIGLVYVAEHQARHCVY